MFERRWKRSWAIWCNVSCVLALQGCCWQRDTARTCSMHPASSATQSEARPRTSRTNTPVCQYFTPPSITSLSGIALGCAACQPQALTSTTEHASADSASAALRKDADRDTDPSSDESASAGSVSPSLSSKKSLQTLVNARGECL